jgi:hypothetical protein
MLYTVEWDETMIMNREYLMILKVVLAPRTPSDSVSIN